MLVLGFSDYRNQGEALATTLGGEFALVEQHTFPDGESRIKLPLPLPAKIILCRSLNQPNDKLIELLLTVQTARNHGVERITLVTPYLCYMRQDTEFHSGEAVSQQIIGRLLATLFDTLITVDPHMHRIHHLEQAIPTHAVALSATGAMAEFLATQAGDPMLIGPDEESEQWVSSIASPLGLDYRIARKERRGDRDVSTVLPEGAYQGREIVLVDDMISTGRTLMAVSRELIMRGAGPIHCLVTHALFDEAVARQLHDAGITHIWSTDSVTHPSNVIPLAGLLAAALHESDSRV